jgi:hypothetical protein
MLAPDEQMLVDFAKLIRNQIPDKNAHVLPPELSSGAYRIHDLADPVAGGVYEGKVIVDKTYGHAAYGCGVCCGPEAPLMEFDPLEVATATSTDQQVQARNSCGGGVQDFTVDFPTWWTDNSAIATANRNSIHGVAAGTTNHYARSTPMYWGPLKDFVSCPISQPQTSANTNVGPYQVEPIDTASQGPAQCTKSGQSGWVRNVTNQVQYVTGAAYAVSGQTVADTISVGNPNALGISGKQEGQTPTTGDGSFPTLITSARLRALGPEKATRHRTGSSRVFPCFTSTISSTSAPPSQLTGIIDENARKICESATRRR